MRNAPFALVLAAAALTLPDAGEAQNLRDERALEACAAALGDRYEAGALMDAFVRTRNNRHWVHGTAEVPGSGPVRFRCQIYYGTVRSIDYRRSEESLGDDESAWVEAPDVLPAREPEEEQAAAPEDTETAGTGTGAEPRRYRVGWGEGYSPADGITCYARRGACYGADEKLDLGWTAREFPSE